MRSGTPNSNIIWTQDANFTSYNDNCYPKHAVSRGVAIAKIKFTDTSVNGSSWENSGARLSKVKPQSNTLKTGDSFL